MDSKNQPLLTDEILEITFASLTSLIFLVFILFTFRLLRKQQQMLDAYMTASLFFFGLSVVLCVASVVLDIVDDTTRVNMAQIQIAQASNDTEKIAIFLDIFRLIILVVALKSKED